MGLGNTLYAGGDKAGARLTPSALAAPAPRQRAGLINLAGTLLEPTRCPTRCRPRSTRSRWTMRPGVPRRRRCCTKRWRACGTEPRQWHDGRPWLRQGDAAGDHPIRDCAASSSGRDGDCRAVARRDRIRTGLVLDRAARGAPRCATARPTSSSHARAAASLGFAIMKYQRKRRTCCRWPCRCRSAGARGVGSAARLASSSPCVLPA